MSDSVRPHRRQLTRLLRPWDSPGKNTQEWVAISLSNTCMHAKSLQSCPTLCYPMDSSPPGSPVHGVLQARTLERVAISFSSPGYNTCLINSCGIYLTGHRKTNCTGRLDKLKYVKTNNFCSSTDVVKIERQTTNKKTLIVQTTNADTIQYLYPDYLKNLCKRVGKKDNPTENRANT